MAKEVKYHVINGKRYKIQFVPKSAFGDDKTAGECDPSNKKNKGIRILKGMPPEDTLRVIIHEFLHGLAFDMLSEEWVDISSRDLARLLVRLGYKRNENE